MNEIFIVHRKINRIMTCCDRSEICAAFISHRKAIKYMQSLEKPNSIFEFYITRQELVKSKDE